MLCERQHILVMFSRSGVHDAALQPRAECTIGVVIHVIFGNLHNWLATIEIWNSQPTQERFQRCRIVAVRLRVDRNGCNFKLNWCITRQRQQYMQQSEQVFPARQSQQDAIPRRNHLIFLDCPADRTHEGLRDVQRHVGKIICRRGNAQVVAGTGKNPAQSVRRGGAVLAEVIETQYLHNPCASNSHNGLWDNVLLSNRYWCPYAPIHGRVAIFSQRRAIDYRDNSNFDVRFC